MPGLLQRFLPREEDFFELFAKQAENIEVGAGRLSNCFRITRACPSKCKSSRPSNTKATKSPTPSSPSSTRRLSRPLTAKISTPLCSQLDDVIDLIDAAASRFVLYRVHHPRTGTIDLVKILVSATARSLRRRPRARTPDEALKHCIEINRYENESDRLCRTLIAQLFDEEKDSVQIIKWKEIFEVIETAVINAKTSPTSSKASS